MRRMLVGFGLTLFVAAGWALPANGQAVPLTPSAATSAADAATGGESASSAPVAVPEPSFQALRYYRSGNRLWVLSILWSLAVPAFLLLSGFSARLRSWALRLGRVRFFATALYFVFFCLTVYLLDLPLAYYSGFVRQHAYGLSNQSLGRWLGDSLKVLALGAGVGGCLLWFPYLLIEKSPRRWWLYLGALSAPFLALALLVVPIWIDPLFNHFGPMQDKALERKILHLAERAGIEGGRVFEIDKSADTTAVNAYVSGLLSTQRIVLWDTLLAKLDEREVLFVLGHEMGHYVLGHVAMLIGLGALLSFLCLFAVHRTGPGLIRRFEGRFGFRQLSDVASLPLFLLLGQVAGFLVLPLPLAVSRHNEREADRFGLEITRDNHAAAMAFAKLQSHNLGNPRPGLLFRLWRADHPPLGDRIDFCNRYHPWETGEPLVYGDRIDAGH
jgi:STE24 endopeptidase